MESSSSSGSEWAQIPALEIPAAPFYGHCRGVARGHIQLAQFPAFRRFGIALGAEQRGALCGGERDGESVQRQRESQAACFDEGLLAAPTIEKGHDPHGLRQGTQSGY